MRLWKRKLYVPMMTLFLLFLFSVSVQADVLGKGVKITYLGHAAFRLVSPGGVVVYIDPFLKNNPKTPAEMKAVEKADLILVTHGHGDHLGDTVEIAGKTNAKVIAIAELARYLTPKGVKNVAGMNKGGTLSTNGLSITMVHALHSSSVTEGDRVIYTGDPAGFVIRFENGFTVYHAGDTAVFSDMEIIGEVYQPELAMLPIGSHYTMDPKEATYASKLLEPKFVIPMHYETFPVLSGTPQKFMELMKQEAPQIKVLVVKPGETIQ